MDAIAATLGSVGYTVEKMENGRGIIASKRNPYAVTEKAIKALLRMQQVDFSNVTFKTMIDQGAIGILEF